MVARWVEWDHYLRLGKGLWEQGRDVPGAEPDPGGDDPHRRLSGLGSAVVMGGPCWGGSRQERRWQFLTDSTSSGPSGDAGGGVLAVQDPPRGVSDMGVAHVEARSGRRSLSTAIESVVRMLPEPLEGS